MTDVAPVVVLAELVGERVTVEIGVRDADTHASMTGELGVERHWSADDGVMRAIYTVGDGRLYLHSEAEARLSDDGRTAVFDDGSMLLTVTRRARL